MEYRFFHADVFGQMSPNQTIDVGSDGFSRFGTTYAHGFTGLIPSKTWTDELRREVNLEMIRRTHFPQRLSRLHCMFAALTVEGAMRYTRRFRPTPGNAIAKTLNVYEVFATRADVVDMLWLDIAGLDDQAMAHRYAKYWAGFASTDSFGGVWREPLMEALLGLPARIGEVVHTATPEWGTDAFPSPP